MTIHKYKIYALTAHLDSLYQSEQEERIMSNKQNRRSGESIDETSDSTFAALFPDELKKTRKSSSINQIKFPHTKEHRTFTHLLNAHSYIRDHNIINPSLEHIHFTPNEWRLEWNIEEQG